MDSEPRHGLRIDAVWDIETAQWDRFVCGAVWDARTNSVNVHWDEDDLAEELLALPKGFTAWAHAGGKFDVLWLLDWCHRRKQVPEAIIRLSGSSIASLAIKGGPIFRDSARLMPMALAEACQMFPGCALKQRLSLPCNCGKDCGGYCAIRVDMPAGERALLTVYLEADVLSLRDTLHELCNYAEASELDLAGTVASTGWNTARGRCGLWPAKWELEAYRRARAGYYGGRCEVGRTSASFVQRYDRKQAYPAALIKPLPTGEPKMLERGNAGMAYGRNKLGIYYAAVQVPEMHAPPLPVRFRNRICYPWGLVIGSWPLAELQRAEEVGATILKFHGGIAWPRAEAILAPHIHRCFELREKADNKPLKTWIKFVANSLTGAFAQDPEFDLIGLGDGEEYTDNPAWKPVGRYNWIWRRGVFAIPQRGHVHFAATLTADARVELHREIAHAGDAWCMSDTDSCIATQTLTRRIGEGLGEWAYEGEGRNFVCLAPKVYSYETDKGRIAKAKGIPRAVGVWPTIMAGEVIPLDRGVDSLLVAARGDSLFHRRAGTRSILPRAGWVGGRIRDGSSTRAPSMGDLPDIPK